MQTIIQTIQQCAPRIAKLLQQGDARKSGEHNASGDEQLALDVRADCLIADAFKALPCVRMIASEERENPEYANESARYCVAYDPLDGSSVVACDFAVGSIFGIYDTDFRADRLVAAAYILYGFALELVVATNSVVEHFRYQNDSFVSLGQLQLAKKAKSTRPAAHKKNGAAPMQTLSQNSLHKATACAIQEQWLPTCTKFSKKVAESLATPKATKHHMASCGYSLNFCPLHSSMKKQVVQRQMAR